MKKSPLLKDPLFCGQCHGLGPNLEFETPVQCATLYGSYLHAYLPNGGSRTCQDCHMPGKDHTSLPNFNDRDGTSARLREALPLEVETWATSSSSSPVNITPWRWLKPGSPTRPATASRTADPPAPGWSWK